MGAKHLIPIDEQRPAAMFWADIIEAHSAPGDVVLVPFAVDTTIAGAALKAARRVILLVRTPAQQLRLWARLVPIDEVGRRRALSRLAETTKRDMPLDLHIQSLYQTTCSVCGEQTSAIAFILDPTRQVPVEKELACQACGFLGRMPADEEDVKRAAQFERRGLSFWFILEWLVDAQDTSGREIARRHLDSYSPRNLMALADITRKIDADLADDPASQHILRVWLLHALDAGRLQPDPIDETRIVERNVWHLLTHAPAADGIGIPVRVITELETFFRKLDPAPNVALVAGPVRRLARELPEACITLMVGAPPVLDADAWTWEQLWSRWVFGRGAAGGGGLLPPIGGWTRHVRALGATMATLLRALRPDGHAIFHFQDGDLDRAHALLMAMAPCARIQDFVYQPPVAEPAHLFDAIGGTYHIAFTPAQLTEQPFLLDAHDLAATIEKSVIDAASDVIAGRAEPLLYGWIAAAAVTHLAESGLLHQAMIALGTDISPLAFIKQHMRQGLRTALSQGLLTAVIGERPTHWWLPRPPPAMPLAERVQRTIIDLLSRRSEITQADVYQHLPGWLTPEAELVQASLVAYGEEIAPGVWRQRTEDPEERQVITGALRRLGERLGFAVGAGMADVVWGEGAHATHVFRVVETGHWSDLGIKKLPDSVTGYLVLPDRLVDLLRVILLRDPLRRYKLVQCRWTPIKARHLLALAEKPEVDRQELKKIVGLDPIIERAEAQIPLF